jgi:preprotein translocase subunit SecA
MQPSRSLNQFLRSLFADTKSPAEDRIAPIQKAWELLRNAPEERLREPGDLIATFAAAAEAARRVLSLEMHPEQLAGALALADGKIAEMQTGEGKTLAAVPAVTWLARQKQGVHVLTVNDYLARRDALWMGPVYRMLGVTTGFVQQGMTSEERRESYARDVTYVTANECGFDLLRDQMCLHPAEQVHRPFAAALLDECDSILIDEARIPLVIAGGIPRDELPLALRADQLVRNYRRFQHYNVDEFGRNIALTDRGIRESERAFRCENLFDEENLGVLSAIQDALHAHAFLRRDVDYIVKNGVIESVDEFKGRVAKDRRWPAGLHTAIEAKEGVALKTQGEILGSITLQNLVGLYSHLCGMTGTAATQATEFRELYQLEVEVIPTHRPVIREDASDVVFAFKRDKEEAVLKEILRVHATGRPVLVGTQSVEESERLASRLALPHEVLNARHDETEAAIVARAGERDAITISTNMAGRGTDIRLGEGVAELGGLHVIGTNKHESRRIDHQLRGRAGRQGDPGSSRFFISLEDDLFVRFATGILHPEEDVDAIQRIAEGQNLGIRTFLWKYESVIEGQRQRWQARRQAILTGTEERASELERVVALTVMDEFWSGYLASITELRQGVHWVSWGGRQPLFEYLKSVDVMYREMEESLEAAIGGRLEEALEGRVDPTERGATWTYLTTDQPFGTWTERVMRGLRRWARERRG